MERKIKDMEKLELKHLVCYLTYGLKFYDILNGITHNIVGIIEDEIYAKEDNGDCYSWYYKESEELPILRPLSDLTKDIIDELSELYPNTPNWDYYREDWFNQNIYSLSETIIEYCVLEKLIELHFDVFGLIDKNLAIDINNI